MQNPFDFFMNEIWTKSKMYSIQKFRFNVLSKPVKFYLKIFRIDTGVSKNVLKTHEKQSKNRSKTVKITHIKIQFNKKSFSLSYFLKILKIHPRNDQYFPFKLFPTSKMNFKTLYKNITFYLKGDQPYHISIMISW